MDGNFYVDSRLPFLSADIGPTTIVSTNKAIVPVANLPILGSNYFSYIGKAVRIRMFGRWSTAATPGTQTFSLFWGTGADANGTSIVASQIITPAASLVNNSWEWDMVIRCRAMGATGSLIANGTYKWVNSTTLTTAATEMMVPASANAAVTVDLTAALLISPQVLAVTSTTNTMSLHDFLFEALN